MPQIRPPHVITAAALAAAMLLATPAIDRYEGYSLTSYPDASGISTACHGDAYVLPHHTYTDAECKIMDAVGKGRAGADVAASPKVRAGPHVAASLKVVVPTPTLAAHVTFSYNVGIGNYRKSKTLRLTNAGD